MKEFLEKVKEKISSITDLIKEKVLDLYENNKKFFFIICGMVVLILLCLILLLAASKKSSKKTDKEVPGSRLELTEPLIIPDGPELPRNYNTSRKTKDKWSEEEAEPWFTIPDTRDVDALSHSNDNMVNEIIGAAP